MEDKELNVYEFKPEDRLMLDPVLETARMAEMELKAVLAAVIRLRGLKGDWRFDGQKLTRGGQ